jgi:hypothetical protein
MEIDAGSVDEAVPRLSGAGKRRHKKKAAPPTIVETHQARVPRASANPAQQVATSR